MKIYTRTGDKGQTSLFGGKRVSKSSERVEVYGTVDELNSLLGVVISLLSNKDQDIKKDILSIQHDLFDLGSYLANPAADPIPWLSQRTKQFEEKIDVMTENLPQLRNFLIPGGDKGAAFLQVARTITRRLERRLVSFSEKEKIDPQVLVYINRLSDFLFTVARFVNHKNKLKEIIWQKR